MLNKIQHKHVINYEHRCLLSFFFLFWMKYTLLKTEATAFD